MENADQQNPAPVASAKNMLASSFIDRVGVPLVWFGIGYLVCRLTRPSRKNQE